MAGLKRFQYTEKDHAEIVADCISRIKQSYGEKYWNDFEEDNAGRMLIEAYAYISDLLLFYLDHQANETYLATATERQNIINMCKLIAYAPKNAKPSHVELKLSLRNPHGYDVTLPSGATLETKNGVIFETDSDAVIKAGNMSVNITATEGETFEEVIGVSDGEADQDFYLPRTSVIEIQKVIIGGHVWKLVDSVADQQPDAEVYMTEIDAWGRARIFFGDGHAGKIPAEDEEITAVYRIGGGVRGNVAPNTIVNLYDAAMDEVGETVPLTVTNEGWAGGGSEPESIQSIKLWAPRFFETQKRGVTQRDYETLAMSYDGIAKARAVVKERSGEANVVRYYVLSYGATSDSVALAPQLLKNNLLKFLNNYKMLTNFVEIEDGKWREIDFSGVITISQGLNADMVLGNVKKALSNLLDITIREMGQSLRISDAYAAIDNVEGVVHVELNTPSATINAENNELLILGDIDFKFIMEGASLELYGENF